MNEQVKAAILYLNGLGYGRDSISLILKGIANSSSIRSFVIANCSPRTREETAKLRSQNKVTCIGGKEAYAEMRKKLGEMFPGMIT